VFAVLPGGDALVGEGDRERQDGEGFAAMGRLKFLVDAFEDFRVGLGRQLCAEAAFGGVTAGDGLAGGGTRTGGALAVAAAGGDLGGGTHGQAFSPGTRITSPRTDGEPHFREVAEMAVKINPTVASSRISTHPLAKVAQGCSSSTGCPDKGPDSRVYYYEWTGPVSSMKSVRAEEH
jgi:hypothetical protein